MPKPSDPVLTANGRTQTHAEWEKELGLKRRSIYARLRRGCTPEEAVQPLTRETTEDMLGRRYGRLVVTGIAERDSVRRFVEVTCDCGVVKHVAAGNLKNDSTHSCGCKRSEDLTKRMTTHGASIGCDGLSSRLEPEYKIWRGLRQRCRDENSEHWMSYGGRGITFDERWLDYTVFLEDMGRRPGKGYSIDRIDVNGNYCKENCRWATNKEQANNTRCNVKVTCYGETLNISQWAEKTGLPYRTLHARLRKCKTEEELRKALEKPIGPSGRRKNKNERTRSPVENGSATNTP